MEHLSIKYERNEVLGPVIMMGLFPIILVDKINKLKKTLILHESVLL